MEKVQELKNVMTIIQAIVMGAAAKEYAAIVTL